jgi:hypothetical protein
VIKEILLSSKEMKMNIKSYLEDWVRYSNSVPWLMNVNEIFWNIPEGFVTIVSENCSKGSLKVPPFSARNSWKTSFPFQRRPV